MRNIIFIFMLVNLWAQGIFTLCSKDDFNNAILTLSPSFVSSLFYHTASPSSFGTGVPFFIQFEYLNYFI